MTGTPRLFVGGSQWDGYPTGDVRPIQPPGTRACSSRIRSQIRCAVCHCFRNACSSIRRISSITRSPAPVSALLVPEPCAQAGRAQRLPQHPPMHSQLPRHTPGTVPTPKRYCRRICSNSSTLRLLSITLPVLAGKDRVGRSIAQGGAKSDG